MDIYQAGRITAVNGSAVIEGFGTRWLNYVKATATITISDIIYDIQSVDDNHQLTLTAPFSGASVERGPYEIQVAPLTKTLAQLRVEAATAIDALAGQVRLKYITDAPGQQITYAAKLDDARAYITAGYPADATTYPWINAEAVATGRTPPQIADAIVYTAGLWAIVGAKIEAARQSAKQSIGNAVAADIDAIKQAFIVAMAAL